MDPIQMLWIGSRLSAMERLSIASFLANGHEVHLYTYDEVEGIPPGTRHLYAGDIVKPSAVFTQPEGFGHGSPAPFSDYFRYKLLHALGGIWCDSDVVCLRPFDFPASDYVVARERIHPGSSAPGKTERLSGCVLKAPAGEAVMAECCEVCEAVDRNTLEWGDLGPNLLTRVFADHGIATLAFPADAFCAVDWWEVQSLVAAPLPQRAAMFGVHLWSEVWRHLGLDKDARYAPECAYEALRSRYPALRR